MAAFTECPAGLLRQRKKCLIKSDDSQTGLVQPFLKKWDSRIPPSALGNEADFEPVASTDQLAAGADKEAGKFLCFGFTRKNGDDCRGIDGQIHGNPFAP